MKHQLKARYYLRYCDDLVLLSEDRQELERWEGDIEAFPEVTAAAAERARQLRPVADGIDFLGYIVRPDYLLVRRRVVGALRARLVGAEKELVEQGLTMDLADRTVYPWPWAVLERIHAWLNPTWAIYSARPAIDWLSGYGNVSPG